MTWTSHGPVNINVARDLNIYGCAGHAPALPCDVAPRHESSSGGGGWAWPALKFLGITLAAGLVVPVALAGAALALVLFLAVCLCIASIVLGIWIVCRFFQGCLWLERLAGGGPKRLVYVPSFLRSDDYDMPALAPGERINGLNQLESDYAE